MVVRRARLDQRWVSVSHERDKVSDGRRNSSRVRADTAIVA
jgi:hypothetical protein